MPHREFHVALPMRGWGALVGAGLVEFACAVPAGGYKVVEAELTGDRAGQRALLLVQVRDNEHSWRTLVNPLEQRRAMFREFATIGTSADAVCRFASTYGLLRLPPLQ